MRLAIISDIHSNFRALQAVLADIDDSGIDKIVSLGDNIGYGPEPEEVISTLMEREIISVLGNHELALNTAAYAGRLNPPTQHSLEITRSLMGPAALSFCGSLPTTLSLFDIRFVHGCPPESVTAYLWDPTITRLERLFTSFPETFCFFGHTHDLARYVACANHYSKDKVKIGETELAECSRFIINPGSVGQPRDGISNKAKYGILDTKKNTFEHRAVPYDVATTVALLRERKFPESNALRLL